MAVISHGSRIGGKLPRGPHQLTSEEVAEDQRKRLIDAIMQLAAKNGYAATTVADVIQHAEVSRKTFYAHFADRDELLLAAFDESSPVALEQVRTASRRTGGPTRQIEALMRRLCRVARESPSTIALSTVEIAAIDPAGLERHDRLIGDYGELIVKCLAAGEAQSTLSPALSRAIAGATFRTIDAYLRSGRVSELRTLAPQLARWARIYHPVPAELLEGELASPSWLCGSAGMLGGRAPGTLTLSPDNYEPPKAVRSPGFTHHSNRERILDAVAQLTAADGYTALTAQSIADHADLSERAFLAHFKNKDDAFAGALEIGHAKAQATVERARSSAPDWVTGVREAIYALLEFLAAEPDFTRLAFVDAPLARTAIILRTYEQVGAYSRLLLDKAPLRRRPPPVAPEAVVHGLFELAFHYAAQRKLAQLPQIAREAAYLALAPFVGVTEAAKAA